VKKEKEVLHYDKNNYQAKRIVTKTYDGKNLAISLLYHIDNKLENVPFLLYGYGSYGLTIDAYLSLVRLPLLDRGFGYAIAHIRGGAYYGRHWYDDGKLLNKKNTFHDFNTCAEYLISSGLTSSDKLFAWGGSAGGLLMGAVSNMKPELYRGIISMVPFVDVVTTMLDESIPLTVGEFDEWGNPAEKEFYDYMKSYSPYDQLSQQKYPNMFISAGLHDGQVAYWEPAKYVAKLRELKRESEGESESNLVVFRTDMDAGHGGSSGRFKRYEHYADAIAFVLTIMNANEAKCNLGGSENGRTDEQMTTRSEAFTI
jgi:oligopeptidase B